MNFNSIIEKLDKFRSKKKKKNFINQIRNQQDLQMVESRRTAAIFLLLLDLLDIHNANYV
jgi:hypothetical protein